MKIFRLNYIMLGLLCMNAVAQQKKLEKTYRTDKNVNVVVDATHTDLLVDYWDKNEVQITAVLETAGTQGQEHAEVLKDWQLETRATSGEVSIKSAGGGIWNSGPEMLRLQEPLAKLPEMVAPLQEMIGPLLQSIPSHPLPPEFSENLSNLHFDFEAYQEQGDKYLEKFEKQVEENFGKEFEKSMEAWAIQFERDSTIRKQQLKKLEHMSEKMEQKMDAWGEDFGEDMQQWAREIEKDVVTRYGDSEGNIIIINGRSISYRKVLRIKMPATGTLDLEVRHGDVELHGVTTDLAAELSHSSLTAGTLRGKKTHVKAAYTPVVVERWSRGVLNASYVPEVDIKFADQIRIDSNSSDTVIGALGEGAYIQGSFGDLQIHQLQPGFNDLEIVLQNSDLELDLPQTAYVLEYEGLKSEVKFPEGLHLETRKTNLNEKISGFNKNKNAPAKIRISADFSDIELK